MNRMNTLHRIGAVILCLLLLPWQAIAAEEMVFENDSTRTFNARTLILDQTDRGGNLILQFGATLNKRLQWNAAKQRFEFSGSVDVQGTLSGSTVHAEKTLTSSGDLLVRGTMSGAMFGGAGLTNCSTNGTDKLLWNASTKTFSCGTDQAGSSGLSVSAADARYVNTSGDTMTGALTTSGAIATEAGVTLNSDNAAANAVLTFGNNLGQEILQFSASTHRFEFSDDVRVAGDLSVTGAVSGAVLRAGNMTVSGAVVYSSGNTLKQTAKGSSGQLLLSQGTAAPIWATPVGGMVWYFDGTQAVQTTKGPQIQMPLSITLTDVSLSAKGAPTGASFIVDINKDGTSIFATRPQINSGSTIGGGDAVFSTTDLSTNSILTVDIDQVGSTFAGSGITVILRGVRKY